MNVKKIKMSKKLTSRILWNIC